MSIGMLFFILTTIFAIIFTFFIFLKQMKTEQKLQIYHANKSKISKSTVYIIYITSMVILFYILSCTAIAMNHGMHTFDMTFSEMNYATYHTQLAQKTKPKTLTNSILIFYRFDCNACTSIHDDLMYTLSLYPETPIYFIDTQSNIGQEFIQTYHIDTVPTAVYIDKQNIYHKYMLSETVNDEIQLSMAQISALLEQLKITN